MNGTDNQKGRRTLPLSLLLGVPLLAVGLGSQLWGLAIAGGFFVGFWVVKQLAPKGEGGH